MSKRKVFLSGLVFIVIYFVVLNYIFPGYFKPFVPHHSDILDYAYDWKALDYSLNSRPIGLILTSIFGLFGGMYGIVLSSIICIFGSALLLTRIIFVTTGIECGVKNLCIYFILLLTAPSFYINYSFDIYTTYSLFIGLLAVLVACNEKCFNSNHLIRIVVCFFLYLACFLCKETYIVSFIFFHCCKLLKNILDKKGIKSQVSFLVVCIFAACLALLYGKISGSAFTSASSADITSPYYTSLNPVSVIRTFLYYFLGLCNPSLILALMIVTIISRHCSGIFEVVSLGLSGVMAYLPYAVLPNKVVPHYIFVAYPLLLAVVLLLKFKSKWVYMFGIIIFIINIYYNTVDSKYGYEAMRGWLKCDNNMELTLTSIDDVNDRLNEEDSVLVLGLEETTETIYRSATFSDKVLRKNVTFYILNHEPSFCGTINDRITYISEIGDIHNYTKVVQYNADEVTIEDIQSFIERTKPSISQVFPAQTITQDMLNDDGSLALGIVGDNIDSQNVKIMVDGKVKTTIYGDGFISTTVESLELDKANIDVCLINILTNEESTPTKLYLDLYE